MTKMKNQEMKSVLGGHPPELVECICYLMDRGWDYNEARVFCTNLFEEEE